MDGDDARKQAARELAAELATPAGLRRARLLQRQVPAELASGPSRAWPRPISIWEPREVDGERAFVRPEPGPFGDHYAAAKVLLPKRSELPLRVALFGESAAAGYLWAPHLTPAKVLEAQLRAMGGAERFEVVDLARTNETLGSLVATVEAALQINPDVLVLFAGNNWNLLETPEVSPYAPSVTARQRYASALREGGLAGPAKLAQEEIERRAGGAFDDVAAIARAVGIPVVVVVPEVNLADWESRQPVHWLPRGGVARWYAFLERALARPGASHFANRGEAAELAREMIRLDGGLCPTSHRLLARAAAGLGRLDEAAEAARAEVDAARYPLLAFLDAPRARAADQELLRREARRHGFLVADLPVVFAEHTGTPLPGRRLFLDYCHLSAEGMRVAMAAVAERVLDLSGLVAEPPSWQELARLPLPPVAPEAAAVAALGAAVHGAHRLLAVGPKRPILEHWCGEALAASPRVAEAMLDLVAVRCAQVPAVLTAAQGRNLASDHRLQLQHGWRWDFLDAEVLAAIGAALAAAGDPLAAEAEATLVAGAGLGERGADLARAPYPWEPVERFYPEVMDFEDLARRATWRCPWPETSFALVVDGARDVGLELTARLPPIPGAEGTRRGRVEVRVNGVAVGGAEVSERWSRAAFRAGRELLRRGLNRVTLAWPMPPPVGEAALAAAVERLELGLEADLHPVFGEVFSLLARPV